MAYQSPILERAEVGHLAALGQAALDVLQQRKERPQLLFQLLLHTQVNSFCQCLPANWSLYTAGIHYLPCEYQ